MKNMKNIDKKMKKLSKYRHKGFIINNQKLKLTKFVLKF